MKFLSFLILVSLSLVYAAEKPELNVYTYSSFTAEWGPGAAIEKEFESVCGCDLKYTAIDDGVALLSRIRLEGEHTKADVVLGLDTNLMAEASSTGLFAPHEVSLDRLTLPVAWRDQIFVPYDYGYFAFVYDRDRYASPETSMAELIAGDPEQKILLQDPRTSTPGLGLLLWMRYLYGEHAAEKWRQLKARVLTVSKGWSEAYGLFLEGEAPLVLSYTTSPAYHAIAEKEDHYAAALFDEGHYLQVEVAARLVGSGQPELARQFLEYILTEDFQKHIPTGNWMYPVINLGTQLPDQFAALPKPEKALLYDPAEVGLHRKQWISEWLDAMTR